ncbi:hypothetical protein [Scytonema hofmannii]|nr:hypothetical protein [Scytonema hofmannii]
MNVNVGKKIVTLQQNATENLKSLLKVGFQNGNSLVNSFSKVNGIAV